MKFIVKKTRLKVLFSHEPQEWYFIIVAHNGKTLATSETYKRKGSALKAINSVIKGATMDYKIVVEP